MSIEWTDEQLTNAKIDKAKLLRLVKKLRECSKLLCELDILVYGSDGSGYLVHRSHPEHDKLGNADFSAVIADVGLGFDGGGW